LALGVLGTNPFGDATPKFFDAFEAAVNCGAGSRLRVIRPFDGLTKCQVMELGRGLPLEWTFSCIAPVSGLHCGQCNKCAERQAAFGQVGWPDPTLYARAQPGSTMEHPTTLSGNGQE
jgi:7-cyano-7-deazaguanine synthase